MNRAFQFASLTVIVIAFIKIVFLLEFWVIPTAFFCVGLIAALAHQRFSLYLFLFLFPFINSSPELFKTDYPFNYIAPALFLLGGMVTAEIVKRLKSHKSGAGSQAPQSEGSDQGFFFYHLFLILLVISTVFVFLRWSNIGLPGIGALGADTPAAPETPFSPLPPEPQRISFASIFPVVTLFIYFISPFIFFYIKKEAALPFLDELERLPGGQNDNEAENTCFWCRLLNSMKKKQRSREADMFKWLSFGFYISVALAVMQKISGRSMISDRLGKELKQFYGGFSDFNAFGFFSGVMFLWSTYQVTNKNLLGYITFAVSLGGTVLSGSRTAFLFILAGVANLVYAALKDRKKQQKIVVIILVAAVVALVVFAGGTLTKRLSEGFSEDESLFDKVNAITNGRLWMTLFSLETIRDNLATGVGTGNFTFYLAYKNYPPYKQTGEKYLYDLPLNHYLLVFTENGILGLLFFTGFMVFVFLRSRQKLLLGTILAALLLNNFFWFPENFLLFWILAGLTDKGAAASPAIKIFSPTKKKMAVLVPVVLLIIANIISFHALHPATWAGEAGYRYDYGFWYGEKDQQGREFRWTTHMAGVYVTLTENGLSPEFKLFCGAPLDRLKGNQQVVEIYWKGKLYREIVFKENREESLRIEGTPRATGFLEIKVKPVFNLEKLGLSPETRDLGVQVFW